MDSAEPFRHLRGNDRPLGENPAREGLVLYGDAVVFPLEAHGVDSGKFADPDGRNVKLFG